MPDEYLNVTHEDLPAPESNPWFPILQVSREDILAICEEDETALRIAEKLTDEQLKKAAYEASLDECFSDEFERNLCRAVLEFQGAENGR